MHSSHQLPRVYFTVEGGMCQACSLHDVKGGLGQIMKVQQVQSSSDLVVERTAYY